MVKGKLKAGLVVTIAMLMCIAFAGSALADNWGAQAHGKGSSALSLSGSYSYASKSGVTANILQGYLSYEYFAMTGLGIGVAVQGMYVDGDTGDDSWDGGMYGAQLSGKYYFVNDTNAVPYIGISGGFMIFTGGDESETGYTFSPSLGVEFMTSASSSVFLQYRPQYLSVAGESLWMHNLEIGLAIYF